MKALDVLNVARDLINKEFDTTIYEGIQDHRESWWWFDGDHFCWFDEKPDDEFDQIIERGPMYSEVFRSRYDSKCGGFIGLRVSDECGNHDFYIIDKSKCLGELK